MVNSVAKLVVTWLYKTYTGFGEKVNCWKKLAKRWREKVNEILKAYTIGQSLFLATNSQLHLHYLVDFSDIQVIGVE